ncbi:Similar to hypothetical protein VITISV_009642 [Vitis vinifera]; acc. no. CAN75537 [Pyronema omphalodes CBS 100304]|uniref:Retrovirus-related Pol polyprotein from transposon TNT 1-94-like beta-barrel domain-containing protein n=1 Tax=Pyronema omphalodes (strain CBS 100304) TaxID=1076935 RepID=U4L2B9_PYROM|nr:Similar to hypothetical protein VITISV_009642 [Vitis vinifera]; acc. no. CAN75537 [Pyronema omphalodes CBS 100304]
MSSSNVTYPDLPKVESQDNFHKFFGSKKFNKDMEISTVKLDNIEVLTGHDNYEDWRDQMMIIFDAMQVSELVIDGATPAEDADDDEYEVFKALKAQCLLVLIQVLSKPIIKVVAKKCDPHAIWVYLENTYHCNTAFSFVQAIMSFTCLASSYDRSKPIMEYLDRFETEWNCLYNLTTGAKSTNTYRKKFRLFLEEDKAKRDFLLGFLVNPHSNVVDNVTTKDDLSYSDVVLKLHSLSSMDMQSVALKAYQPKGQGKKKMENSGGNSTKECTYCRKHHLGNPVGHTWNEFRKLKAKNEEKKKEEQPEEANVAKEEVSAHALATTKVSNPSITHTWIFNTGASSHMMSNKEHFESLSAYRGTVKIGNSQCLEVEGKAQSLQYA